MDLNLEELENRINFLIDEYEDSIQIRERCILTITGEDELRLGSIIFKGIIRKVYMSEGEIYIETEPIGEFSSNTTKHKIYRLTKEELYAYDFDQTKIETIQYKDLNYTHDEEDNYIEITKLNGNRIDIYRY